ncbi:leucyl/phenylalanyl-tRNA--protein transferase [Acetatifactor aquisgranensis]|uniref:leucyl/phenylalanyl-tRNA--protein transferase n=1 Tax=Acetatifactor aquisgranensis TaxID=2941233 RepID=UPI002040A1A4|nr:leucyl/phenylalanyl-tRNA--protein transferase [Acetatifactor aquisgranensis]MCI8543202.1 leucyl/phenylalanyl-tRNA--protein transferase [Lachnospiraceae bacterium]
MPVYRLNEGEISFPSPMYARRDGLLAVGGDLTVERLLLAYTHGIFPWYDPGEEILWWCPRERFVIFPEEIHISHSMRKYWKKHKLRLELNRDFADTMHRCRTMREFKEGTWISDEMEEAYLRLHESGYAVSAEVSEDGQLAGGLYGVSIGRCFFGESMFSEKENGSKAALIAFARLLERSRFLFMDCQFHTEHLESMGGRYISWEEYDRMLAEGTGR